MGNTNWLAVLGTALVAQLGLSVLLHSAEMDRGEYVSERALLEFDPNQVDELRIEAQDSQTVLAKSESGWRLPDYFDFPASSGRIETLLKRLSQLEPGWPVGRSADAATRFKVGDDAFERKLSLRKQDQDLAVLFLGTSPGFRKVHARTSDTEEIFAVEFGTFEAAAEATAWIDRTILQRDLDSLRRLELGSLILERQAPPTAASEKIPAEPDSAENESSEAPTSPEQAELEEPPLEWTLLELQAGEQSNPTAVRALAEKLAKLLISDVLGTQAKPEYGQDTPLAQFKVYPSEGDVITYTISKLDGGSDYVLKVSGQPYFLKVTAPTLDPLLQPERSELLVAAEEQAPETREVDTATEAPSSEEE